MAPEDATLDRARPDLEPTAARRLSAWLNGYKPISGIPDELFDYMGRPREYWLRLLGDFAELRGAEVEDRFSLATRHIRDTGVTYRIYGEETERSWPLNPLPLLLSETEWLRIAAGVQQRAKLMEALLQDFYGPGQLVAEGALPAAVLSGSPDFIRPMQGVRPPGGRYLQSYAVDLGRGPDGRWWVLDDRTQAPSGAGYALENRLVLSRAFPGIYAAMNVRRLAPFFDELRRGLALGAERDDPRICLLTPGPFSETYFEQAHLARYMGFLLVEGDDLVVRDGRVYVRTIAGLKRADVLLRRVDADFLDPLELNGASRLGAPGLLDAIRAGGVVVLNMPGSGVLESKALQGFLPRLCRRILGEDLKIPNVATWWCGQPRERALVEQHVDDLALGSAFNGMNAAAPFAKPRLLADMAAAERDAFLQRLRDRPGDIVGQEVVRLSTTPVLRDGRLEPAPFVLRIYATGAEDGFQVMSGGFCRTSDRLDARAVSMGQDARTADVWVFTDKPVERVTLMPSQETVQVRRIIGHLPSRAADNLFWLGRYLERAEATLRLVRSLCTRLTGSESADQSGETLVQVVKLLHDWNALSGEVVDADALDAAHKTLHDQQASGAVIYLVRAARRTASSMRERLSADFWTMLLKLEQRLTTEDADASSVGETLEQADYCLQTLAALSGLAQENMNRMAGWRFFDMGRRIERGVNMCRFARSLAHGQATIDDLDLLLDLADSQISYRARYLVGLAVIPIRDMVLMDPFNPRSVAFQLAALKDHLTSLPALLDDGMMERPQQRLLTLAAKIETGDARTLEAADILGFEEALLELSGAVADRYFLQGPSATPQTKLMGLA